MRSAPLPGLLRARPGAVVAERVVAITNRLPKARFARASDEVEALLGVTRDTVEERAESSRRREAHVLGSMIAKHLQHLKLIGRHARHPLGKCDPMIMKLVLGDGFENQPDARRLDGGD